MGGSRIPALPEAGLSRELKLQVVELQEPAWPGGRYAAGSSRARTAATSAGVAPAASR